MTELALPEVQTSSVIEAPAADLPAIAKEVEEAWTQIEQSNLGDRMKRALRRVAGGLAIRESAEAEGYSGHADLYRYAKRFGLVDVRTKAIIKTHRNVAKLAGEEMERRLSEDPDAIKTSALAVIGGISTDKVLAYEKTETDDGSSYLSAIEKVAAQIAASGQTLEIRVSVGPTTPGADAIDVTPTSGVSTGR